MNPTINIDELVKPISDEFPAGMNLRDDSSANSLYYQIKDLRNAARSAERQLARGEQLEEGPNWQKVIDSGINILSKHSKDLEVTAWVTEGLLRKFAFAGLRDGFQLFKVLLQEYPETIFPLPDEDGEETRLAPLIGLNGDEIEGSLIVPISAVPIVHSEIQGPLALWQYQQALDIEKILEPEVREKRINNGAISLDDFKAAAAEMATESFQQLHDDIVMCQAQMDELYELLDDRYGQQSPPSYYIRQAIDNFLEHLMLLADGRLQSNALISAQAEYEVAESSPLVSSIKGDISNRNDALMALLKVSDYFEKTEPHSPLPYILKRAVKWGNLPLPDLLREIIASEGELGNVFKLTGIES